MVVVPEGGGTQALSTALPAKPFAGWWIDFGLAMVAEQRDAAAFDQAPVTVRSWLISDVDPEKRHRTDVVADSEFQWMFAKTDLFPRYPELLCRLGLVLADSPGDDVLILAASFQRLANQQSKNRPAVVSSPRRCAAMLRKPLPKSTLGPGFQGVCPDANDARRAFGSMFARLEKEIDSPQRPAHAAPAIRQPVCAVQPVFQPVKNGVEPQQIGRPIHRGSPASEAVRQFEAFLSELPRQRGVPQAERSGTRSIGVQSETLSVSFVGPRPTVAGKRGVPIPGGH